MSSYGLSDSELQTAKLSQMTPRQYKALLTHRRDASAMLGEYLKAKGIGVGPLPLDMQVGEYNSGSLLTVPLYSGKKLEAPKPVPYMCVELMLDDSFELTFSEFPRVIPGHQDYKKLVQALSLFDGLTLDKVRQELRKEAELEAEADPLSSSLDLA